MIHLHGKNKKKIAGLVDYKDLCIESELQSGDKTLCFSYSKKSKYYFDIVEEGYITTKENEYVIKEKNVGSDYTEFKCVLNLEDLEGRPFERYESVEQPIDKALALALAGTGWIVGKCSLKKKRTVRATNCSSLEIIKNIRKTYRCDLVFNTLTRTIDVYERLGEDKGAYFIDSLNLKELYIQGNSYDFFTRIIPIGKDDLRITSINDGKEYVENYQYSNKIKTIYWKDDRYTIVENLKEDAEAKLDEISKPYRAYSANILNLAKLNDKYKDILDYKLGDTITLISKDNKFRDKQRIVKIKEYPDKHELDSVEIANTILSFEERQTQFQEAAETVDNITTDNGTVDGSTIDSIKTEQISDFETSVAKITDLTVVNAKIKNLEAFNVTISGRLTAVEADIGSLNANIGVIDKLTVTHSALINDLQANKASITQLEAVNATIQVLEANVGKIETLVNGNLSSKNLQAGSITARELAANAITAGSTVIGEGAIGNAQISSLSANKIDAGTIDTSRVTLAGPNGHLKLMGNRLQVFTGQGNSQIERVSLGDILGDGSRYGLLVRGVDNKTIIFDENGVTNAGITDGSITNDKINSSANIDGSKLNINSVITKINEATETISGTKIQIGDRTLDLELSTQNNTITEHGKELSTQKSTINALDNKINLKVDESTYKSEIFDMNKKYEDIKIKQHETDEKINSEITDLTTNLNELGNYLDNDFKDGVLDKQEIEILKGYINNLEKEKMDILAQVNVIESYTELLGSSELNELINSKMEFISKQKLLIDNINLLIETYKETNLKIHFIQTDETGDAILIQTDNGKNIMLDSNGSYSSQRIINYMKSCNVKNLDYIIVSHHHSDHVGGMPNIINAFNTENCIAYQRTPDWSRMPAIETEWKTKEVYDNFINACNSKNIQIVTPFENQRVQISDNTYIEFYNTDFADYNDYNSLSICVLLVHKNKKYFFIGDINNTAQTNLLTKVPKADVLKGNHHDFNDSANYDFYKKINPSKVIITNPFKQKPRALSGYCQYNNIPYFAQFDNKTIVLTSTGYSYELNTTTRTLYKDYWWDKDGKNTEWYWFKSDGAYAKNEDLEINGKLYNFDENGICTNPY